MLFNSLESFVFLPLVLLGFFLLPVKVLTGAAGLLLGTLFVFK
jgi:hypothetical protein